MIKCIAFDADNTLYQTRGAAKSADMAAMDVLHNKTNIQSVELYKEFVDIVVQIKTSPDPKIRHRLYSYNKLAQKYNIPKLTNDMYAAFSRKLLEEMKPMPDIKSLVQSLAKHFELWVITEDNKPMTLKKLMVSQIDKYFKNIISSDDTGVMKPNKKYYDELLAKFKPEEIFVVGDNYENDLAIPSKLGIKTLLVKSPADLKKVLEL